ncbi:endonuclease-reverse transcriptase domain-containing protein [Hirsutella rhossiliensis]
MNDEDLKDFAALAISEPHARNIDGKVVTSPMGHHNWTKMIPTCVRDALWLIRSMLWIRSDLEAEQVPVPSADLTAAVLRLEGREVMVVSVRRTDVVLAGDFNRHDLLWGGDEVSASRQGEGEPIIDLMDDFGLSSLLARGTKTWQRSDEESTIDLVLASAELADELTSCVIHPTEHGSDHRAIQTTFDIRVPERTFPQRLMLKNAPWIAIATRVEDELRPLPWTPPPYAKRWWTKDLTRLRRTYTYWRNQARAQRRAGQSRPDLEQRAKEAAKESNIWRAANKGEQAEELLSTFFPPLPTRIEPEEIEEKVMAAKPWKAPGEDGLPAIVWKKLWHVVKHRERIYKAWRTGRVLSLISFDVKGAYNGVCKERMLERMKARGIPNLVQRRISNNGGSIAFMDDYSAWVTGPTAESNIDEKTSVIHFTRIAERDSDLPLIIKGNDVKPKSNVKLLGVIMDKALRFKEHIARMASPRMARQLFVATVAPAMDYASNAVTGGFRTVATAVAEGEAGVQSFRERHAQAAAKFWIRMRTLPKTHPLTSLRLKLNRRYASPMQKLASAMGRLDTKRLEVIHEFALAPWDERVQATYEADRAEVLKSDDPEDITIATSSSQRKGKVGLGGVVRDASRDSADEVLASYSVTLGSSDEQNVYTAGLEAIAMALSNRSVLQVIGRPRQQSGEKSDAR